MFPILNAVRTELSWTHYRVLFRAAEENLIYFVRGMYVMLDRDMAFFFEFETKSLNLA